MTLTDEDFFASIVENEDEIVKKGQNYETYIGNLRAKAGFRILPFGYLVMVDSDNCDQLKTESEKNFVYVKMLRKIIVNEKRLLPVCLRCNERGHAEAIINGTNAVLPDKTIENDLVKCKHEVVSKVLYQHQLVEEAENNSTNCTILKSNEKIHLSACYDGNSYATIACKLAWGSRVGKCSVCKGSKCRHQERWNKELRYKVLKEVDEKSVHDVDDDEEDEEEDEGSERMCEVKEDARARLKFPPTESTRVLFQKYETDFYDEKLDFVDEHQPGRVCVSHGNEWSNLDPVEMKWCFF